jgi:hypothetical protein
MGRIGGNPDLKGNANSGRKKVYEEHNKANAINKLWEKVNKKVMEGETLTEYEEKLVLAVLPKTIKTNHDVTSDGKTLSIEVSKEISEKHGITSSPKEDSN